MTDKFTTDEALAELHRWPLIDAEDPSDVANRLVHLTDIITDLVNRIKVLETTNERAQRHRVQDLRHLQELP
jgi:hypothetical protein